LQLNILWPIRPTAQPIKSLKHHCQPLPAIASHSQPLPLTAKEPIDASMTMPHQLKLRKKLIFLSP
jgi:hypothetical protein